jgi:hypothetical protein
MPLSRTLLQAAITSVYWPPVYVALPEACVFFVGDVICILQHAAQQRDVVHHAHLAHHAQLGCTDQWTRATGATYMYALYMYTVFSPEGAVLLCGAKYMCEQLESSLQKWRGWPAPLASHVRLGRVERNCPRHPDCALLNLNTYSLNIFH